MKNRKAPKGFSLVELLLVISIIGVLATIAFPVMSTVYLRAKQTERTMMIRNVAMAVRDLGDRFPQAGNTITADWNPPLVSGHATGSEKLFDGSMSGWNLLTWSPDGAVRYHYKIDGIDNAFTVCARSDLNSNGVDAERCELYQRYSDGTWNYISASDTQDTSANEW